MPFQIGSKRNAEPLMLSGSKRLNIEEYNDFDNAICDNSNNQLVTSYSGIRSKSLFKEVSTVEKV